MAKLARVLIVVFILTFGLPVFVHAERGSVSVDTLWLGTTGVDTFVGRIGDYEWSEYEVWDYDTVTYIDDYDYAYLGEEVVLSPDGGGASLLGLKFELFLPAARGTWLRPGLRLTYWENAGDASATGEGPGLVEDEVLEGTEDLDEDTFLEDWRQSGGTFYGVQMWGVEGDLPFYSSAYCDDAGLYVECEQLEPGGEFVERYSRLVEESYLPEVVETAWYADSGFANRSAEAVLEFPVTETDKVYFALLGGGKYANWTHHEELGVSYEFIDAEILLRVNSYPYEGAPTYEELGLNAYDETWDLDSTAKVTLTGIGPCAGAFGRVRIADWLSFVGKATYSYLFGQASMEGLFTSAMSWRWDELYAETGHWDEETQKWVADGFLTVDDYASGSEAGEVPVEANVAMNLGILEYQLGLEADFGPVFFGLGWFGSTWFGVPLAPGFSYETAAWDLTRRTTVNFGGFSGKVGIRF